MKDVDRLLENLKNGNYNNYLDEVNFEYSQDMIERESAAGSMRELHSKADD